VIVARGIGNARAEDMHGRCANVHVANVIRTDLPLAPDG